MIYRTCHLRIESVLLVVLLLSPMTLAWGQDEEPTIEFFYPVVTRRPVIERELELSVKHSKSPKGREAEVAAAFEWPILPRWQLEVEFPFVIRDPAGGPTVGGLSDIAIENKVLLYKSVEYRLLVSGPFSPNERSSWPPGSRSVIRPGGGSRPSSSSGP